MTTQLAVIVAFHFGDDFDSERVANVAREARSMFERMPVFYRRCSQSTSSGRRATNFYVWDSAEQAHAFFTLN